MIVFIYTYLKPLIEAGKVYKVFSPLYRLDDKEHPFVVSKAEMVEVFQKKVAKHYKVTTESGYKLDKDEMIEFLQDTYSYSTDLIRMAKNLGNVDKFLVEQIIALLTVSGYIRSGKDFDDIDKLFNDQKFIKNFMSRIQEKFPEITANTENHTLKGVVNGKFCSIKINKRFIRQAEDLIPIYRKYQYKLLVLEKGHENYVEMSIGEFLDQTTKLSAKILNRFKGLAELDAKDMFSTALDINNRVSIQYTLEDAEREVEIFNTLHGNSKKDMDARKKMMSDYKISKDDLDN